MKKLTIALLLAATPLVGGCVYPGYAGYEGYGYSGGAYAAYDPGYDFGYAGYQHPPIYADAAPAPSYYPAYPAYQAPPVYPQAMAPMVYGPQAYYGGSYSTYYCPPTF